ncbi:NAD-dependent epimerase/dehydratase family protein [Actibacterium lipolyticum]|uniref:dTDP-4-oxo-6-deoxy-D-allose reductase n=1 Tax=Actibacterium lipolyticum TaxID=1524263 RepID=A0A238KYK5_9RHOB|nr:NAD(P)-dependent oxidoreductase [Actibacterium lipolyticum]SMX47282.1 dTDP-4-oxo-6-deoxy-D-allose reductase [Actibacterium lipolyticum]
MKTALSGSTGMIGRHMLALLRQRGVSCRTVTRADWDLTEWLSFEAFDALFGDADVIFHFAAKIPGPQAASGSTAAEFFDTNVRACANLGEWAASRRKAVVFLSSGTVYANPHAPVIAESAPTMISGFGGFYAMSKVLAENVLRHYSAEGMKLAILRPSSVYGFGMAAEQLVPSFLAKAKDGQELTLTGSENRLNLIHAHDLCRAALAVAEQQIIGIFNVAGPAIHSIRDIADTAVSVASAGKVAVGKETDPSPPFLRFDLNCERAAAAFGYRPIVGLEMGLSMMAQEAFLPGNGGHARLSP